MTDGHDRIIGTLRTWRNLKFKDPESGTYYSDGRERILDVLDLGTIIAGETGEAKGVLLVNENDFTVKNVQVWVHVQPSQGDRIELSLYNNPFIPEVQPMRINGTFPARSDIRVFYVRAVLSDVSAVQRIVFLRASADPA